MNVRCLLGCFLLLGATMALAEPPRVPVTMDPNDPEKRRTIIPRAEREQLGLAPQTWSGVVDPRVYVTMERLLATIERLKETRTGEAPTTLFLMQFPGTVYVEVHLKRDPKGTADSEGNLAGIRDAQRRVLRSLTAYEFRVAQLFERSPGFVGFATREGLDKLGAHQEVVGVCLDMQPLQEKGPKTIYKNDLSPAKPGEAADEPGVAEGKVDADVYRAFALTDRVDLTVSLRRDTLPDLTDVPSEMWARNRLRRQALEQLWDKVLSTVNADQFWTWTSLSSGVSGFATREGVEKLQQHPDVVRVYLRSRL